VCYGDSCLDGAGGYSVALGFWWHIKFPYDIVQRTLLHKANNDDGKLISINVLVFITVIINYMASLHVLELTKPTEDPYPVLLNITDNSSAQRWTTTNCKGSTTGRLLARLFCSLLINSPLGINSKWIPTAATTLLTIFLDSNMLALLTHSHLLIMVLLNRNTRS
jgi:hypothetical protein